jgi:hypothetical protein
MNPIISTQTILHLIHSSLQTTINQLHNYQSFSFKAHLLILNISLIHSQMTQLLISSNHTRTSPKVYLVLPKIPPQKKGATKEKVDLPVSHESVNKDCIE